MGAILDILNKRKKTFSKKSTIMASVTRLIQVVKPQAKQCQRLFSASVISKTPERVGTEVKPDLGKDKTYKAPEFFGYDNYSFYDIEVGVVDEGKRCPQPESGLTEYW